MALRLMHGLAWPVDVVGTIGVLGGTLRQPAQVTHVGRHDLSSITAIAIKSATIISDTCTGPLFHVFSTAECMIHHVKTGTRD